MAKILKVIAHPIRLEILEILEKNEPIDVGSIREKLTTDVEQSMLSHHLNKMKDNGIITSYKQGKNSYYSLLEKRVLQIFDCLSNCKF